MNTATKTLEKLGFKKTIVCSYEHVELDNNELHELLNEECVFFQTLCDQDVWSFSDGSYITRSEDDYFDGSDVRDFELTAEMARNEHI